MSKYILKERRKIPEGQSNTDNAMATNDKKKQTNNSTHDKTWKTKN